MPRNGLGALLVFCLGMFAPFCVGQQPAPGADAIFSFAAPPRHVPTGTVVDGAILGNGDLGVVFAGPGERQEFYFGKNDFWSKQAQPLSVGGLRVIVPALAQASFHQEEDIAHAEVRSRFEKAGVKLEARSWVAQQKNLFISEWKLTGSAPIAVSAAQFPEGAKLRDNAHPVNLGREQDGNGKNYFHGLIDEVHIYDRALSETTVHALAAMAEPQDGLVRRWGFDEAEGTTPQDTQTRLVLGPNCPGAPPVHRSSESPEEETAGCSPSGYSPDYQLYSIGRRGRAPQFAHQWAYVDCGTVPPLKEVTVAAWIYIYSAGDSNFILSKGKWNDAYALLLDHGRLRFNVDDQFVRSWDALPLHRWIHVAGTFDGQRLKAYVDGAPVAPSARLLAGGATGDTLWTTRSADGPIDDQLEWDNPIGPVSSPSARGREVTMATRVIGTSAVMTGDQISFQLRPGQTIYFVTAVLSDIDAPDHLNAARGLVAQMTPENIAELDHDNQAWWKQFWAESSVDIGDRELEKYYYSSQYVLASSNRTGKVNPGLYANWVTTDHPSWNGDYTLNYNIQTPDLALYSSNHVELSDPYDAPVLDFMLRAKSYARTMLGVRGVYYPGHMGPWGMERPFNYDPFMGQKSDAAFLAQPMLMRFYSTYDRDYATKIYPFLREVGQFWEDYLSYENGRYVIHDDCMTEVGPWLPGPQWQTCKNSFNSMNSLGLVRSVFHGLINVSSELNVDSASRPKWQFILDHLSQYPTYSVNGKTYFANSERSQQSTKFEGTLATWASLPIWPGGQIGFDSDPGLLETARNSLALRGYTNHPLFFPELARVGYDPDKILDYLHRFSKESALPNGYLFFGGGGIETASAIPGAINEMLLQSYEGVLRLFPDWPHGRPAAFTNLRAYGAFLVSSRTDGTKVQSVSIFSEKGRRCVLLNPWPGRKVRLTRNSVAGEVLAGDRLSFNTSAGELLIVQSM